MMFSEDTQVTGIVFNIQHYSVHDGPGIRSNIFLKGCPLACRWCSNPESQSPRPELAFKEGRCLGIFRARQTIALSIPAHGARLIRLTPLRSDRSTVVIGTSLSLTGGMELTGFRDNRPVLRPGVTAPCRVTLLRDGVPFTLDAESSFF